MRKKLAALGLCSAITSISVTAWALVDTSWFAIDALEASEEVDGNYRIYPLDYTFPVSCTNMAYAEMNTNLTQQEKDAMNKTLLSAFLAGKKVKLTLAQTCNANNRPQYQMVRLSHNQ